MTELPGLDSRKFKNYTSLSEGSRERYKGFVRLKEYKHYYLCGRFNDKGELLYKECFSKFDVDGVRRKINENCDTSALQKQKE